MLYTYTICGIIHIRVILIEYKFQENYDFVHRFILSMYNSALKILTVQQLYVC